VILPFLHLFVSEKEAEEVNLSALFGFPDAAIAPPPTVAAEEVPLLTEYFVLNYPYWLDNLKWNTLAG
jgi:hypothetical protein